MSLTMMLVDVSAAMCQAWNEYFLPPSVQIINQSIDSLKLNGVNVLCQPGQFVGADARWD